MANFALFLLLISTYEGLARGKIWFGNVIDLNYDLSEISEEEHIDDWTGPAETCSLVDEFDFENEDPLIKNPIMITTMLWRRNKNKIKSLTLAQIKLEIDAMDGSGRQEYDLATFLMEESSFGSLPRYTPELEFYALKDLYESIWYRKESNSIIEVGINLYEPKVYVERGKQETGPHCMKIEFVFTLDDYGNLSLISNIRSFDYFCDVLSESYGYKPSSNNYVNKDIYDFFNRKNKKPTVEKTDPIVKKTDPIEKKTDTIVEKPSLLDSLFRIFGIKSKSDSKSDSSKLDSSKSGSSTSDSSTSNSGNKKAETRVSSTAPTREEKVSKENKPETSTSTPVSKEEKPTAHESSSPAPDENKPATSPPRSISRLSSRNNLEKREIRAPIARTLSVNNKQPKKM